MKRARLASGTEIPELDGIVAKWPGVLEPLDGAMTYVRRTPARSAVAEPTLYVHGLGGSSLNWTDLAYLLADRLDGEAIDLPGFGYSDPAKAYGVEALAERVGRWIEQRDRGPVHLFGNSLGGAISVWLAGTRPELVRTLTLISPAMPFIDPRRSLQSRLLPLLLVPRADRIAAKHLATVPPEELVAQVVAACYAEPEKVPPERLMEAIEEIKRRYDAPWYLDAYLRTLRGLVGTFFRSYLPGPNSIWRVAARITAPTLIVAGRQDQLVDVRTAPAVGRVIKDSRLMVLDRVGHVAQMERPVLVARAVIAMLDEVAAPAAAPAPLPVADTDIYDTPDLHSGSGESVVAA